MAPAHASGIVGHRAAVHNDLAHIDLRIENGTYGQTRNVAWPFTAHNEG